VAYFFGQSCIRRAMHGGAVTAGYK